MDDDWIAADLEILDSISLSCEELTFQCDHEHCTTSFQSSQQLKSHQKMHSNKPRHKINVSPEDLQLVEKLASEFLKNIGIDLPENFLKENTKSISELIMSYRRKPDPNSFYSGYSSMCHEAYKILNLPQEDAAVVLIKVMDAIVKANSANQFEVNRAGLEQRESGRSFFVYFFLGTYPNSNKTPNFLVFLTLDEINLFNSFH